MSAAAPLRPSAITFGVMARAPHEGRCKTRLARAIGAAGAARLYEAMLLDTLDLLTAAKLAVPTRYVVLAAPEHDGAAVLRRLSPAPWEIVVQRGEDLGERLANALQELAAPQNLVCLVSSDSPTLPPDALAPLALPRAENGVVAGPCEDGGYYLIGTMAPDAGLFEAIPWSTSEVMDATRRACAALARPLDELPIGYDIDEPADLERLSRDTRATGRAPRTARALRDMPTVGR